MSIEKKLLGTNPASGDAPNIEDVFSTYLYEGTGSASNLVVSNGVDLDGEGGLIWFKKRSGSSNHNLYDSARGIQYSLYADSTSEHDLRTDFVSWNSDGFTLTANGNMNQASNEYASWTFRKRERFFDVVTYTGNEVAGREIAHNLGVEPGMIIVKSSSDTNHWRVYHRSLGGTKSLQLNATSGQSTNTMWNNTNATSSVFTVDDGSVTNILNYEYVAYLFAHDPNGENDDGMIACGSYAGNNSASSPVSVDLGWQPQYILVKNSTDTDNWYVMDTMRGLVADPSGLLDTWLRPNLSSAEIVTSGNSALLPTASGFDVLGGGNRHNASSTTYIYMAIRAPMMKEPEAGSDVFKAFYYFSGNSQWGDKHLDSGFTTDMALNFYRTSTDNSKIVDRLRGYANAFKVNLTSAEGVRTGDYDPWTQTGQSITDAEWNKYNGGNGHYYGALLFKRAKSYFDVVAYTGNSTAGRTVNHSLGVAPEMMWVKRRDSSGDWLVYTSFSGATKYMAVQSTAAPGTSSSMWNDTEPTDSVFTLGTVSWANNSSGTYVAYLFATAAGVSKVGNYTGNGGSQNIACGFSGGARFVLIKRTDSSGDWYIWDTERGIVSGNDPHKSLNTQAAEVTSDDSIDPQSAGFTVNQVSATNINVSSGTYIFLAIA